MRELSRWGLILSTLVVVCTTGTAFAQEPPAPLTLADALRLTLVQHPALRTQQEQVNAQKGTQRQAAGQFNLYLNADASQGHTYRPLTAYEEFVYGQYDQFNANSSTTNTSRIQLAASKQLRNGIVLTPNISATRVTDNLTNRGGISQGSIQFQVTVPLLRGWGRSVVTAQEVSAARQVEAAVFEVNETLNTLLATTAYSYWNVVGAEKRLAVLREAEGRSGSFMESTQALIDADRLPRVEINSAVANRAQRIANRIEGEKALADAKAQLAIDMGWTTAEITALPEISTGFPAELDPQAIPSGPAAVKAYVDLAIERRPELQAIKKRVEASQVQAKAAQNGLKPQLDVRVAAGVSGLDEGARIDEFLFAPAHAARGPDVSGSITYRFPPARDAAAGLLQQTTALEQQARLQLQDTERRTAAAISPALFAVQSEALQVRQAHESVRFYQNALEASRDRLQLGVGSLIDILQMEDRLIGASQTEIQAELQYAQSLVRLRQATSTIVTSFGQQGGSIDPAVFSTIPPLTPATQTVPAP